MDYIAPTPSPWEQMQEEITKPSAEDIAFWKACDEYAVKCQEYGDE